MIGKWADRRPVGMASMPDPDMVGSGGGKNGDLKDTMATALRQNGCACQEPRSARPDSAHSSRNRKAWILNCEPGSCRVRFKGAGGAEVAPLGE